MKKIIVFLLLITNLSLIAQNEDRTNTLITMAMDKAVNGCSVEEINEIFSKIDESQPNNYDIQTAWGTSILICAKDDYSVYESAFDKFRKATEIKQDDVLAYFLWAKSKYHYAKEKNDKSLFQECSSLYQKTIEIDPGFVDGYADWGAFLLDYGRSENNVQLYQEALEKLEKAIAISPERIDLWEYKGWGYLRIGKSENNLLKYKEKIVDSLSEADRLGGQMASYNMACYYSLINEKELALKWFEKMLFKRKNEDQELKKKINEDKDFDNIRNEKKFKELIKRFF